jgi:hypothetical protein
MPIPFVITNSTSFPTNSIERFRFGEPPLRRAVRHCFDNSGLFPTQIVKKGG